MTSTPSLTHLFPCLSFSPCIAIMETSPTGTQSQSLSPSSRVRKKMAFSPAAKPPKRPANGERHVYAFQRLVLCFASHSDPSHTHTRNTHSLHSPVDTNKTHTSHALSRAEDTPFPVSHLLLRPHTHTKHPAVYVLVTPDDASRLFSRLTNIHMRQQNPLLCDSR